MEKRERDPFLSGLSTKTAPAVASKDDWFRYDLKRWVRREDFSYPFFVILPKE